MFKGTVKFSQLSFQSVALLSQRVDECAVERSMEFNFFEVLGTISSKAFEKP